MHKPIHAPDSASEIRTKALILVLTALIALTPFMTVQTVRAEPKINIDVDSQILVAGAENTIVFTILNWGNSTAQDINATVTVPTSMMFIDSDGRWNLTNLSPGQSTNIVARAYVSPSAAGNLIQLTVRVTYTTNTSSIALSETKTLGFSVATVDLAGAYLNPYFSTYDFQASQNNSVVLIIENQGQRQATSISVSLGAPSGLGSGLGGLTSLTSLSDSSSLSSGSTQFLLYNNTGRWNFDSLPANGSLVLPLTIFVMPSAAGSISMFPVTLTYTDGFTYTQVTRYATVRVLSVPGSGINFHVGIDPQEFHSGGITHATINVTNIGAGNMDAVSAQLSLSGSSSSGSSSGIVIPTTSGSPFVLLGQDGSWLLGEMAIGETRSLPIDIYTSPSAAGNVVSVSVSVSYTDPLAKSKQETKQIGIIVRGLVDIYVMDSSTFPSTITVGKAFSASINIINLGTSSAEGMLAFPQSSDNLTSLSAERIFLGDVEVNIPTSLTISYVSSNITNGTYPISIPYTYKDSLGGWVNGTLTVPLKLTVLNGTENQAATNGSGGIGSLLETYWWVLAIAIVVIVVAIYFLVSRRKTQK